MKVTVQLFAGLAEEIGTGRLEIDLDHTEATVAELKNAIAERFPEAAEAVATSFAAINQRYARDDERLSHADEIALIPPVSGGQGDEREESGEADERYVVTEQPLSVDRMLACVIDPNHGASLLFVGTTREWTEDKRTVRLEYEAYVPMAVKTLRQIGDEVKARWPGAKCAIAHRIGTVAIGEPSVVIAVSTPHREQCYEASRYAIERLKQIVPIWKKEVWDDGAEWKGYPSGPWDPFSPPDTAR